MRSTMARVHVLCMKRCGSQLHPRTRSEDQLQGIDSQRHTVSLNRQRHSASELYGATSVLGKRVMHSSSQYKQM